VKKTEKDWIQKKIWGKTDVLSADFGWSGLPSGMPLLNPPKYRDNEESRCILSVYPVSWLHCCALFKQVQGFFPKSHFSSWNLFCTTPEFSLQRVDSAL